MYTLGYPLPAVDGAKAIADGPSILLHPRDRARARHRPARSASATACGAPRGRRETRAGRSRSSAAPAKEPSRFTCNFLFMCSGYYDYDEGYTPEFPGIERFAGRDRPSAELDRGPRLRRQARGRDRQRRDRGDARAGAGEDGRARHDAAALADLHRRRGPPRTRSRTGCAACCRRSVAYGITRWKNVLLGMCFYQLCRRKPETRQER